EPGVHTFVATFPNHNADPEGPVPALGGPGGPGLGGPLDVKGSAWRPSLWFLLDGKIVKEFEVGGYSAAEAAFSIGYGGPPIVAHVEIEGPYNAVPVTQTASRERIFICSPTQQSDEAACARNILATITRRAFRRDISDEDLQPILGTYEQTRARHDFDRAIAA